MEHPLPPRPAFIPSNPTVAGPSRLGLPSSLPSSSTSAGVIAGLSTIAPKLSSATPSTVCSVCSQPAKYTCPRCATRTCSLGCSKSHKSQDDCSGIRDPTSFVSLKDYGQGAWSDDYTWLEQGRRKASEWGENIKPDEMSTARSGTAAGRGQANGRGRGNGRNDVRGTRGKKGGKMDGLRKQLERCGCTVDFMPEGMARRRGNQSSWNPKTHQLHLTVHLSIPAHLVDSTNPEPSPRVISHQRVLFSTSEKSANSTTFPTLASLLPPSLTVNLTDLIFVLPFQSTPSRPAPEHLPNQRLFYPPLDPAKPLSEVLRGTAWVEFPIIEIIQRAKWDEGVEKGEMAVVPLAEPVTMPVGVGGARDAGWGKRKAVPDSQPERVGDDTQETQGKRVKVLNPGEGLMALGDYASDDESEAEDAQEEIANEEGLDEEEAEREGGDDGDDGDDEDPPMDVLQAVGMALVADLGEVS